MSTVTPFSSISEFINLLQTRKRTFYLTDEFTPPIVSIISSFFNAHQYFEETYQSVINQTFQNYEWIIVNDCSTDIEAIALFQSLPSKSRKIKTLQHSVNKGLSAGRNTAIAQAKGKYLFFIDLDDLIDPTYIEKCVLFLETHPDFSLVNSYSVGFQAEEYWWNHGFDRPAQFIQQNWVTGRLLYRQSDFNCLGGFDETLRVYGDWERWLRAIVNGQKGWTIPEYLDCYRRTDSSLLGTSLKNPVEDKREISSIQSLYQPFFDNNHFSNIILEKHYFDTSQLRANLSIKNQLKRQTEQQNILCFFPYLELGGSTRFNLDLVSLLTKRGYSFTIATTIKSKHDWNQYFYNVTPDIFHLPNLLDPYQWLNFARYIIESRQIDLVFISNCYIAYYFLPILRYEFPNVSFVDFTHTIDPGWRSIGYPRISCQFSQFLDRRVVTSEFLATVYQSTSPIEPDKLSICYANIDADLATVYQSVSSTEPDKLRICYTNIDTQQWIRNNQKRQQLRLMLNITDNTVVFLFPARIVEQKRPFFLVEIIKTLIKYTLSISMIVVGNGELLSAMKAKINQLNLEPYIHILPPVEPTEMLDFYSAADILLLPSAYEGISLAIYEAMAMQLPVVASDVGGQAELVTPETGFLVAKGKGDEHEVEEYLQVLLPLIQEPQLRAQVGDRARQRIIKSFSLVEMANQMEAIFQEATSQRESDANALRQKKPKLDVDLANDFEKCGLYSIAEEALLVAIEYLNQEQVLSNLWQEKCWLEKERNQLQQEKNLQEKEREQLESERHELAWKKRAMESSKFWQLRKQWFKLKRWLRLTQEEEI